MVKPNQMGVEEGVWQSNWTFPPQDESRGAEICYFRSKYLCGCWIDFFLHPVQLSTNLIGPNVTPHDNNSVKNKRF